MLKTMLFGLLIGKSESFTFKYYFKVNRSEFIGSDNVIFEFKMNLLRPRFKKNISDKNNNSGFTLRD